MKILAVALLGTSTFAAAEPDRRWHDRYDDRDRHEGDRDRYDRHDRDDVRIPRDQWTTLATRVRLEGRDAPRIELNDVRVRSIELQAIRGSADIVDVGVIYTDGTQRAVRINRRLDARSAPNVRFDLPDGMRGVHVIVVEGTGNLRFRVIGG